MRKKLLVIHTPPPFGGGEIQALNLKNHFINKKEFIVYDYSRNNHNRSDWEKVKFKTIIPGIYWIFKVHFLIVYYRPSLIYFTIPKGFVAFLRNASIIPIAKLFKVKILGELPGASFPFLNNPNNFTYKVGLKLLRQIDELRFLSKSIADIHHKYNLKKSVVINNGIKIPDNTSVNKSVFYEDTLNLIYVGALEESKGIFNSFAAIKICKESNIQVHLKLIGNWTSITEEAKAYKYISDNLIQEQISFYGSKIDREKWEIFTNCALLLHPTYWDGVPLSILESLALGIPIISTSIGGIPDTIIDGIHGTILEENTPDKIFESISFYYANRQLLEQQSILNQQHFNDHYDLVYFLKNMEIWFK